MTSRTFSVNNSDRGHGRRPKSDTDLSDAQDSTNAWAKRLCSQIQTKAASPENRYRGIEEDLSQLSSLKFVLLLGAETKKELRADAEKLSKFGDGMKAKMMIQAALTCNVLAALRLLSKTCDKLLEYRRMQALPSRDLDLEERENNNLVQLGDILEKQLTYVPELRSVRQACSQVTQFATALDKRIAACRRRACSQNPGSYESDRRGSGSSSSPHRGSTARGSTDNRQSASNVRRQTPKRRL